MTMRSPRFPAFRRRRAAWLVALAIGACACGATSAGERWARGGRATMMRAPSFAAARPARPPGGPRPAQGREQVPPQPGPVERPAERPPDNPIDRQGRPGRLTPDERRALRQQINDAGRDIYRAPRP